MIALIVLLTLVLLFILTSITFIYVIPASKSKINSINIESISKINKAQKEYGSSYRDIEFAKIFKEVEIAKYKSLSSALKKANINIVSEDMSFMGFNAKEITDVSVIINSLKNSHDSDINEFIAELVKRVDKE